MADRFRPMLFVLLAPLTLVVSMAALPWLWTRMDPRDCDVAIGTRPPSAAHPFGTNPLGCDYFAMTVYGARPSVLVGLSTTVAVLLIGGAAGILAGYRGGWVDAVVSRITEIFAGLPTLLGMLVFLTLLRAHSIATVVAALALLGWPQVARVARGSAIATRHTDYVRAARGLGASDLRIALRHVLPNAIAPTLVIGTTSLGGYIATEATLSYLGVGLRPPTISWGIMINQGQDLALAGHPYLLFFPGGLLLTTVLCLVLIGDVLDTALDPRRS